MSAAPNVRGRNKRKFSLLQNPTKKELENHSQSQQINTSLSERVARERTSESFYQNLPAGMRALRDDDVLINCNPGQPLTQVGVSEPSDVRQLICASAWSLKFPNFSRRFRVRVHTWLVHSSLHSNDLQTTEKSHDFNRVSP